MTAPPDRGNPQERLEYTPQTLPCQSAMHVRVRIPNLWAQLLPNQFKGSPYDDADQNIVASPGCGARWGWPSWRSFFEDECQAETKNLIASTVNSATHALEDP